MRFSPATARLALPLILGWIVPACTVPPRAAAPDIDSGAVREGFFRYPVVYLHVFAVNEAVIPPDALGRSVATIERHLGRRVEVIDHGSEQVPMTADNELARVPVFPPRDTSGRVIAAADVPLLFDKPLRGLLGAAAVGHRMLSTDSPEPIIRPIIEENVIIVVALPGPSGGVGVTGYASVVPVRTPKELRTGVVFLNASVIHRRSSWLVSKSRLYEWTLTHELGHVLGVPASNSHIWAVPGLGPHCTHPECVMYTGLDWRVVLSGVLNGWPLDFCDGCASELRSVRERWVSSSTSVCTKFTPYGRTLVLSHTGRTPAGSGREEPDGRDE
ncbi:MAG: hypothetical protein JNK25_03890 [Phycisphaerae bacterium]|nr:hypothetical protein [Phycisphaerae bacterium]